MIILLIGLSLLGYAAVEGDLGSTSISVRDTTTLSLREGFNTRITRETPIQFFDWLEGQLLESGSLLMYFNTSHAIFYELLTQENALSFKVNVHWQSHAGDIISLVGASDLDITNSDFDAEQWALTIDPTDFEGGDYYATIYINDEQCSERILIEPVEEIVEEEIPDIPIQLPEYECGETFDPVTIANTTPAPMPSSPRIIYLGGFPILVDEGFTGDESGYGGTGTIPIPFGKKAVRVTLHNIQINSEGQVFSGTAEGVDDNLTNYPDFMVNQVFPIGDDICQPPPPPPGYDSDGFSEVTGLNKYGFDENGHHPGTNSEFDENGFDAEGNYMNTGSPYNDQGCNRDGYDENGKTCDPKAGPNPESEEFAESKKQGLPADVENALTNMQANLQDLIDTELNCEVIRSELDDLITDPTQNFDAAYFVGENGEFIDQGMHLHFTSDPKELTVNIPNRTQEIVNIEAKHVALYHCDKKEYAYQQYIDIIDGLSPEEKGDINDQILSAIKEWSEATLNGNQDDEKFNAWLLDKIGDIIRDRSGLDESYSHRESEIQEQPSTPILEEVFDFTGYASYASVDRHMLDFYEQPDLLAEVDFLLKQGDEEIFDVHRAFYLEELAHQQMLLFNEAANLLQPITVDKTVANKTVTMYFDNFSFGVQGATVDTYVILDDAETGNRIALSAIGVSFGPTGITGPSQLALSTDIEMRLNNAVKLVVKGSTTHANWDCDGFKSVSVGMQLEFCRDLIVPLGPDLKPLPGDERYRLDIQINDIESWLEFSVEIAAKPFSVAGHEDVAWQAEKILVDLQSSSTPHFTPISGYDSPHLIAGGLAPAWKGFYMDGFSATFTTDMAANGQPLVIQVNDVIIDETGFSGELTATNLVSINEGDIGGWPFSIDEFQLKILHNQFSGSGFSGLLNVPIFEQNLAYTAVVYPGSKYSFSVTTTEELDADALLARFTLDDNSTVGISYQDGEFITKAHLNGRIVVSSQENNFDAPGVTFQGFEISNKAPYFSPGTWGQNDLGVDFNFGGFSLGLSNIGVFQTEDVTTIGLAFDAKLSLVNDLGISAGGGFIIEAALNETNGRQKWVPAGFRVEKLNLDAYINGVGQISGLIRWYGADTGADLDTWGEGFQGAVKLNIDNLGFSVEGVAQFGNLDGEKYFYVDALLQLGSLSNVTGPLQFKGFGGGVAYNMSFTQEAMDFTNIADQNVENLALGGSFSETQYVVDLDASLSLKATAVMAVVKEELFNGTASFFMTFNDNGGVSEVGFTGVGQFLEDVDYGLGIQDNNGQEPMTSSTLSAYIDINLNFNTNVLSGTLISYLNAGGGLIRGAGDNNKLVDAELHFGPDNWYIYIGTPKNRAGLVVGLGSIQVSADAYFDVGDDIPPFPGLPKEVQELAGSYRTNEDLRQSGSGIAFGASLDVDASAKIAGILEASLEAGVGFDVMLKKYQDLRCANSNEEVGINGWYATGQAWAYVHGALKAFGVTLVEAGFAAVLQARLPNPFWAQAVVGVKLKLGFISVKKSLNVEIGEDCALVSGDPTEGLGVKVISHMTPMEGAGELETSVHPEAFLIMSLGREYEVVGINGTNNFVAEVGSTEMQTSTGLLLDHRVEVSDDKQHITFIPHDLLPPNEVITATLNISVVQDGAEPIVESQSITFETGPAPNYIPLANIESTYPAMGMVNYHKEEYRAQQGFINLISGQPDLLYNVPEEYCQKMRLSSSDGTTQVFDYQYLPVENQITFPMEPSWFAPEKIYCLELVREDQQDCPDLTAGAPTNDVLAALNGRSAAASATDGQSPTAIKPLPDGVLFRTYFRASQFNTVQAKLDQILASGSGLSRDLSDVEFLDQHDLEGFDEGGLLGLTVNRNSVIDWIGTLGAEYDELQSLAIAAGCSTQVATYDEAEYLKEAGILYGVIPKAVDATDFQSGQYSGTVKRQLITATMGDKARSRFNRIRQGVVECMGNKPDVPPGYGGANGGLEPEGDEHIELVEELFIPDLDDLVFDVIYRLPNGKVSTQSTLQLTSN